MFVVVDNAVVVKIYCNLNFFANFNHSKTDLFHNNEFHFILWKHNAY